MKIRNRILFITIQLLLMFAAQLSAQDHQLFTEVLKNYVIDGLVAYKSLTKDTQLDKYLDHLSQTDPDKLNINQKLAFWINAYNAFTLQAVRDNYPIKSINELHTGGRIIAHIMGKTVWDKEFITINNKKYSLNDIEHKILRKMNDARIHFAIVCASISCPELLNEAFETDKIETQLENQAKKFLNDKSRNHYDLKNRKAYISEIFNWFDEDFGKSDKDILEFISKYLPDSVGNDIISNPSKWEIIYNDYNWNLNEIK